MIFLCSKGFRALTSATPKQTWHFLQLVNRSPMANKLLLTRGMPERPTKIAWTSACSGLWSCMKSIYNRTLRQRLLFWILHIKAYQACQVCKWWKLFIRRLKEAFGSKLMIVAAPSITMRRLRRTFISAGSPSSTEGLWCGWGERYGRWRGHRYRRGKEMGTERGCISI